MTTIVIFKDNDGRLRGMGEKSRRTRQKDTQEVTADLVRELFRYEPLTGLLIRRVARSNAKAGTVVGRSNGNGHLQVKINRHSYLVHRLAWLYVHGEWPPDQLDHKNRIRDDNRLNNLRPVTQNQNLQNQNPLKNNSSGIKGVTRDGKFWRARIGNNKKTLFIGSFRTKEDARRAYAMAAEELHTHNPAAFIL